MLTSTNLRKENKQKIDTRICLKKPTKSKKTLEESNLRHASRGITVVYRRSNRIYERTPEYIEEIRRLSHYVKNIFLVPNQVRTEKNVQ